MSPRYSTLTLQFSPSSGQYDTEYLDYLRALLSLLPQYGITAFVNMHQDVWSRYSGGSGAPAWTLTTVGLDLAALEETEAAWLKGVRGGGHTEAERGLWPCGYQKLAAATMAYVPRAPCRVCDAHGALGRVFGRATRLRRS